jgi:hypothetical protein
VRIGAQSKGAAPSTPSDEPPDLGHDPVPATIRSGGDA